MSSRSRRPWAPLLLAAILVGLAGAQEPPVVQRSTLPGPWADGTGAVVGAPGGGAFVAVRTAFAPGQSQVVRIQRLDDLGAVVWGRDITGLAPTTGFAYAPADRLVATPAGGVLAVTTDELQRGVRLDALSADGAPLWSRTVTDPRGALWHQGVVPDGAGGWYLAMIRLEAGGDDLVVHRIDGAGAHVWGRDQSMFQSSMGTGGLGLGPAGEAVWIGSAVLANHGVPFVQSWSAAGVEVGLRWLSGADWYDGQIHAVASDPAAGLLVAGRTLQGSAAASRIALDGTVVWTTHLASDAAATSIGLTAAGHWCVGFNGNGAAGAGAAELTASGQVQRAWAEPRTPGSLTGLHLDRRGSAWLAVLTPAHDMALVRRALVELAVPTCAGAINSTGGGAHASAVGSPLRVEDDVTLFAGGLPPAVPCLFIAGRAGGLVPGAGGSQGVLCLSGPIGRFQRPGEVRVSDAAGFVHLPLDLDSVVTPSGVVSMPAGETWHFQAWYRDANPQPTSNFTGAFTLVTQ